MYLSQGQAGIHVLLALLDGQTRQAKSRKNFLAYLPGAQPFMKPPDLLWIIVYVTVTIGNALVSNTCSCIFTFSNCHCVK